eukprot:1390268-Amphidinium_carterae.1
MRQYGLCTKVEKVPTRKRILSNLPGLAEAFNGHFCLGSHQHCRLEGSEGGQKLTQHVQLWPDPLLQAISRVISEHASQ